MQQKNLVLIADVLTRLRERLCIGYSIRAPTQSELDEGIRLERKRCRTAFRQGSNHFRKIEHAGPCPASGTYRPPVCS
jgi:phosphatidylethanolamine-binding protein (PEBP) family uncharacterized protein